MFVMLSASRAGGDATRTIRLTVAIDAALACSLGREQAPLPPPGFLRLRRRERHVAPLQRRAAFGPQHLVGLAADVRDITEVELDARQLLAEDTVERPHLDQRLPLREISVYVAAP